jgi:Cu2+-exporting ATPase
MNNENNNHGMHETQSHKNMHEGNDAHDMHEMKHDRHANMVADYKERFFISLVLMLPILLLSPMIQMFMKLSYRFAGDSYVLFAFSTVLFLYGGKPFLIGAIDEFKKKSPAMMMLISLAITVAYVYSSLTVFVIKGNDFFWELATLIVIMLLGHWIEMKSVLGASGSLEELASLLPEVAHLITDDGKLMDVPVKNLKSGDMVLIKPGERIPTDGTVFDGRSSVIESMLTGESIPAEKSKGDEVFGGAINGDGILKSAVNRVGDQTFISQIIKLVREAQESKSKTQRIADVASKWLFYIAIISGTLTFILWMIFMKDLNFAVERMVTVIIISCPHALGLAVPLVTAVSTGIGAKNGFLIRDRAAFENARKIDTVVFDKTGTLTKGEFGITDIFNVTVSKELLMALAYSIELNSEHPVGKAIVNEGRKQNLIGLEVSGYQNIPGKGLKAIVEGREIRIVSPKYMKNEKISFNNENYEKLSGEGKTVIFILEGLKLLGYIALADTVRNTAKDAVDELKTMGIESIMLTGDNMKVARAVAERIGIEKVFAETIPQDKALKIDELHSEGMTVGMTGDGINDAPALAKADLGIAIGAGTDVAIETADVILVKNNPLDVVNLLKLSRATYRKMTQNLIWAAGYNVIAIPLAAGILYNQGILISPAAGAVLMSLSTIIVSVNARFLKTD